MHFTPIEEMEQRKKKIKCELYRDNMQNYKKYGIPPAQLIIADVPYNVGNNFYGSNPSWVLEETIRMEKANLQVRRLLIQTLTLTCMNIFTFVQKC